MRGLDIRFGARLVLCPQGMEGMPGVVPWIRSDLAGVEFDRPIYAPVLKHLAERHAVTGSA